jgi:predicted transposase YbfD/YdcC
VKSSRLIRQMSGFLFRAIPEVGFDQVEDPRSTRGRRWKKLAPVLTSTLIGLMAGLRNLEEVEELTDVLPKPMRDRLGIKRRVPDTTARDVMCRIDWDSLRDCLYRVVHAARRRKALKPVGLPFGVIACDGKGTALPVSDGKIAQRTKTEAGRPFGIVRTITCALTSAAGRPCIDVIPIPGDTNEMGVFRKVFGSLMYNYSTLFALVTYDAGAASEKNARLVVCAGKHYLFRLKNEAHQILALAKALLKDKICLAQTETVRTNDRQIFRRVYLSPTYNTEDTKEGAIVWQHAATFVMLETLEVEDDGARAEVVQTRHFVSSLRTDDLTPEQWLQVVRSHWGVENNNHNILDTAFAEDNNPWIKWCPVGMLNILILRRIAHTLLNLYRSVTLRSETSRATPWKVLMRSVYYSLMCATEAHLATLRRRKVSAATI